MNTSTPAPAPAGTAPAPPRSDLPEPDAALRQLFRWCLDTPQGQTLLRATQRYLLGPQP